MLIISSVIIFLFRGDSIHARLTEVIQTDKGPICGEIVKCVQSPSIEYSAFRAIPFAKPPIGQLRFQPPVPVDAWKKTLNATSKSPPCPQLNSDNIVFGSEDCLYLNVYSPKKEFKAANKELLAVMVWIYGGGFTSGDTNLYGPDFLITGNVVVVSMNYRIGALGFLSLDTAGATGNMGLKDQVLALKWVQRNIRKFGGDPRRVTIFGESAGSACVLLHLISPASRGLFRGAIAMSGSPLNPWAFASKIEAEQQACELAKNLGFPSFNKAKLLEKFRNASAQQIVSATTSDPTAVHIPPFMPTHEDPRKAKNVFLTQFARKYYNAKVYSKIPVMLGFTNLETLSYAIPFRNLVLTAKLSHQYASFLGRENLTPFLDGSTTIINDFAKGNGKSSSNTIYSALKETSDLIFIAGIDSTERYLAQSFQPVYYYRYSFDHEQSWHRLQGLQIRGAGHGEDLVPLFYNPSLTTSLDPESVIGKQGRKMIKLWTNFAKYANPTPHGLSDLFLNVTWVPSGSRGLHLEIGENELKMGPRPTNAFVTKIQSLSAIYDEKRCGCRLVFP